MSRRPPGRPKGSTNAKIIVEVEASRCPKCGSSERTKYENPVRRDYSGSGLEFVAIIYRTTRCVDCGQARRDQEKEYPPKVSPTSVDRRLR
jgi:Zn ribbon nucleic-acid-binding protein